MHILELRPPSIRKVLNRARHARNRLRGFTLAFYWPADGCRCGGGIVARFFPNPPLFAPAIAWRDEEWLAEGLANPTRRGPPCPVAEEVGFGAHVPARSPPVFDRCLLKTAPPRHLPESPGPFQVSPLVSSCFLPHCQIDLDQLVQAVEEGRLWVLGGSSLDSRCVAVLEERVVVQSVFTAVLTRSPTDRAGWARWSRRKDRNPRPLHSLSGCVPETAVGPSAQLSGELEEDAPPRGMAPPWIGPCAHRVPLLKPGAMAAGILLFNRVPALPSTCPSCSIRPEAWSLPVSFFELFRDRRLSGLERLRAGARRPAHDCSP